MPDPDTQGAEERLVRLQIVPLKRDEAHDFVERIHRHHPAPPGDIFRLGVADERGEIRGVAMVGRPVARAYDDGWTLEVNRVATDGCPNACSALYAACWRAAKALGWRKLITYTLTSESGSSLKAAGWRVIGERKARSWAERFPLASEDRHEQRDRAGEIALGGSSMNPNPEGDTVRLAPPNPTPAEQLREALRLQAEAADTYKAAYEGQREGREKAEEALREIVGVQTRRAAIWQMRLAARSALDKLGES